VAFLFPGLADRLVGNFKANRTPTDEQIK